MKIDIDGLNKCREQTVNDIIDLLKINNKVACNRYTGFGKSYYVVPNLIQKLNSKCIIVVPSIPLYQQYIDYFSDNDKVAILTYQSIKHKTNDDIFKEFIDYKYIICDECHHLGNNKWRKEFDRFNNIIGAKIIGLTATPVRGDSVNVIDFYFNGIQVQPLELVDGISLGFLPKIKYIVAYAEIEDKFDSRLNEIDRYKIQNLLNVSNILKKHIEQDNLKDNPKILVYVPNIKYVDEAVEQCKAWFSTFDGYNIKIYDIHSNRLQKENCKILNEFRSKHKYNDIDILISVDMITEGLHLPNISIEIMLRKTKSPVKYFQQLGRIINNKQPIIFDLINNSRHLYQMKREYAIISNVVSETRQKIMYDNCINLIDETKDILDILVKYYNTNRIDDEIRLQIYNDAKSGMYRKDISTKYGIAVQTVDKILREFNFYRLGTKFENELHSVFIKNKQYLIDGNGKIPREIMSNKVGISVCQLERLYKLENIKLKRVYPRVELSKKLKDEFIKLCKENNNHLHTKKQIIEKLNISERTYNALRRDKYVWDNIQHKPGPLTDKKINDIIKYIKNNPNTYRAELQIKFHITGTTVNKILNKNNIDIGYKKSAHKITEKDEKYILEQFNIYKTLRGTSIATGFHKETIKKCLIRYNIEPPRPSRTNIPVTNKEKQDVYYDYVYNKLTIKVLTQKYHRADTTIKKIIKEKEINN